MVKKQYKINDDKKWDVLREIVFEYGIPVLKSKMLISIERERGLFV